MTNSLRAILLLSLAAAVGACSGTTSSVRDSGASPLASAPAPPTVKFLTFNALHGLATGRFGVSPGETPEQNETRFQLLISQLDRERPDIVFLQEVNPLPERAERYVTALQAIGLRYHEVHQVDACGVRLSSERALFPGLNNGLAILAREELELKKLAGLQLSGDLGKCNSNSGIQLAELRYALIAEIGLPGSADRYLLACTHLHSGFETGGRFMKFLATLHRDGQFREYQTFRWEIDQTRLRRIGELNVLIRMLNKLKRERGYAGAFIAGDLNFEEDFPEYEEVRLLRFVDTGAVSQPAGVLYTADPVRNGWIRQEEGAPIPQSLLSAIAPESSSVQDRIIAAYRDEMRRPRRIDYILVDASLPHYCLRQTLFGLETDDKGLPASDHYGLLNTYSRVDTGQGCPAE